MKFLSLIFMSGFVAAAPVVERDDPRNFFKNFGIDPERLPGVPVSSITMASTASIPTMSTTTPPTASLANPTALPSTFSAPIQGQGRLTFDNLPALPPVIDKTFSGVLGPAYGLVSGICSTPSMCSITVAGSLSSLLVDGDTYGAATTLSAWCDAGRCYGTADPTITASAPFTITCTYLTGTQACSATIAGASKTIFANGKELDVWGWATPSGYCEHGVCTASMKLFGDPMY